MAESSLPRRPFYAQRLSGRRGVAPWTLDDLQAFAASSGDPFAGRLLGDALPDLSLQLEATEDQSVWLGLSRSELRRWSQALEALLARWGLGHGDTLACYDYGSSPLVLLAAGSYAPRLGKGAAERLGADVVCNDGVASMARRMADVIALLRPAGVVLRADVVMPFADALDVVGVDLASTCRWVAVTQVEGAPYESQVDRYAERLGVVLHRVLRVDAAALLAGDCSACALFHVDPHLYRLEAVGHGDVAVTTAFLQTCPAVRYDLGPGAIVEPGCEAEPDAWRLAWR